MKALLEERITDLERQITHLQAVRTSLCTHRQNMDTLLTMNLSEISVIEKEAVFHKVLNLRNGHIQFPQQ